ncbi:hypothetical protein D3Z50_10970 [Clostridiaceae bacterium]|nr:hypothetical protein [Clostridiaceae bacterium]
MNPDMAAMETLSRAAAALIACCGAATDVTRHKIYNKLTFPSMAASLFLYTASGGLQGLFCSASGLFAGLAFGIFWLAGMLKAGDIKLYMAIGAAAGWRFVLACGLYSLLIGGMAACAVMISRKTGRTAFRSVMFYLIRLVYTRRFEMYQPASEDGYFSFGCCIAGGVFAAIWSGGRLLF